MPPQVSKHFKGETISDTMILGADGYAGSFCKIETDDLHSLREWWHIILRNYGKYPCYAIFLVLPSDKEATTFLEKFGQELDIISGRNCLILVLGSDFFFMDFSINPDHWIFQHFWVEAIKKHISQGESIQVAELFNIDMTKFPCVVFFNDIRSSKFALLSLQGLSLIHI